jgi:hypothetical protein
MSAPLSFLARGYETALLQEIARVRILRAIWTIRRSGLCPVEAAALDMAMGLMTNAIDPAEEAVQSGDAVEGALALGQSRGFYDED